MNDPLPLTGLARALAEARLTDAPEDLAAAWADQTMVLRLTGAGRASFSIGGHLRRSFLGALGKAASPEAASGQPCLWEPPCAFDVFGREQLRGATGDGLPKPYAIGVWTEGRDLIVTLRVFGMANDWAMAAFEAMSAGVRTILPWRREVRGLSAPPPVADRRIEIHHIPSVVAPHAVRVVLLSPMDISGGDPISNPATILSRAIRRADAVSRWNGLGLLPDARTRSATVVRGLRVKTAGLTIGRHTSHNRHRQARTGPTLHGSLTVHGDLAPIWPLLQISERAQVGRHTVEGLGRIRLEPLD